MTAQSFKTQMDNEITRARNARRGQTWQMISTAFLFVIMLTCGRACTILDEHRIAYENSIETQKKTNELVEDMLRVHRENSKRDEIILKTATRLDSLIKSQKK